MENCWSGKAKKQGCGAGAAGADLFCPEPEPEPEPWEQFARSRSRSRLKRGGSGSERDVKSSKTIIREIKVAQPILLYLFTVDDNIKVIFKKNDLAFTMNC